MRLQTVEHRTFIKSFSLTILSALHQFILEDIYFQPIAYKRKHHTKGEKRKSSKSDWFQDDADAACSVDNPASKK